MPPGNQFNSLRGQLGRQGGGVFDDLPRVGLETPGHGFPEGYGLGGDDVHQRAALNAGKHVFVQQGGMVAVGQDEPAARTPQGLMRGGSDEIGVSDRRGMDPTGDQPRDMRHIHHQISAHVSGDGAETFEIQGAGIGARAGDDQPGLVFSGQLLRLHPYR